MATPGPVPAAASFPIPPPLAKIPFVVQENGIYLLSQPAIGCLTALWAGLQGSGGVIPSLLIISVPTAGSVTAYTAVAINAVGQAIAPDNTVIADGLGIFGIATTAGATSGVSINVQAIGLVSNSAWTWTPGEPIWIGNGGVLTQTNPTGAGIWVKKAGVAISATDMYIGFGELVSLT